MDMPLIIGIHMQILAMIELDPDFFQQKVGSNLPGKV